MTDMIFVWKHFPFFFFVEIPKKKGKSFFFYEMFTSPRSKCYCNFLQIFGAVLFSVFSVVNGSSEIENIPE